MRLDLNKLDHLIAVAEEGSVTRAAARLHLPQQALSTSIRVLEREVGVRLLERGTAGVTVLPAGAALFEDARILNGMARPCAAPGRPDGARPRCSASATPLPSPATNSSPCSHP